MTPESQTVLTERAIATEHAFAALSRHEQFLLDCEHESHAKATAASEHGDAAATAYHQAQRAAYKRARHELVALVEGER